MNPKYIASVSFGKDSLAMLLKLIELGYPLDEVVFFNTGMEFNVIYRMIDQIQPLLEAHGIKYTELRPECPMLYKMFDKPVKCRKKPHNIHYGYSWCGGVCRWGTTDKIQAIEKYCKGSIQYIGIAYDEPERLSKERKPNKVFPLADWKMTEKQCLAYCYNHGFKWEQDGIELYSILDRVSCWCCRNKNILELFNYYRFLPYYWEELKKLQTRTQRPFKPPYTIQDLEEKFKKHLSGEKVWKYLYKAKGAGN